MNNKRNSYLFKNTAIFTLGNLATKMISFFLIPLYTNVLSTAEYGIVDLVFTVATVAIPILTLNIMEAVMRFNLDKGADQDKITRVGILILFGASILGICMIPLCNLYSTLSGLGLYIYFYCIASAASQIFLCDLRGKEKLVQYSIGNVLNTLLIALFNIVFLLLFKWGVKGYLLAYTLANSVVAFYSFFIGKGYRAIFTRVDKTKMRAMIKYSIILIPNSFMWWIMNSSDHIMVTSMIGIDSNGIYAISYKLPTLITTLLGIFNQAWSYSAIKEDKSEDVESYTNAVFKVMIGVIMIAGLCMMTFIKLFLRYYVSPDYYIAWKFTPYLIIGCVYMTLGTFMSTSYTVHKDSLGFLLSGTFGALINLFLNLVLIRFWGVSGAALATCISYFSVFAFRALHTRKYMKYVFYTKEFFVGNFALIFSAVLMFIDSVIAQVFQIVILIITLFLFKDLLLSFVSKKNKRKKNEDI